MSLKNYFLKRLCYFLVILTSFYGFIFAQTITVDGDPSDWPAALNGNVVKAFVHDRANVSDDNKFDASKDTEDTPLWDWSIGQVNDKGDITNAGAVLINGDELYFFGDRTAINGDAQIGFWFFQNGTRPVGTTSGNFAPEHAIGDLLILSNFTNGGGQVTIRVYRWVGSGGSEGSLDLVTRTSKAVVNTQYVSAPSYPGWTYQGKNVPSVGTPSPNTYATGSFFEGYVKLERLIETCYASFLMETRNSASVDAALEDFSFGEYNGKPQAPKVTAGSICGPGVVQLSAECASVDNAVTRWYDAPTGGNLLFTGTNYAPNITQTTTYYVACFRSDGLGCESARTPVVATVNPKPEVSLSFDPIKYNGDNTTLVANVTSGTAPFTYLWSNGETTSSISVKAGTYSVVVTDSKGCEVSKEITISEPSKLSMEVSYTPILCNGGKSTVTVSADGGTAPYTGIGSWEVSAGTYTYTVKDANGCEVSKEIMISEPSKLSMEVSYTPILCNGGKSTVTVTANGGTAPYTGTGSWEVSAGTYTYTVKDANGCEVSKEITISEPSKLSMEVSYTPILCNGGKSTVTVSAEGGTAPYTGTGSWEVSAGTYTYTVKDANGCEVSKEITISEPSKLSMEVSYTSILCNGGKSTVTVTADGGTAPYTGTGSWEVSAGTYTYTVKDANGCEVSKKITISEPSKLSMEVSYTPILCNGGKSTVTVSANGGTAPYTGTGSWEVSAGTYTYTVKDANGCEVSKEITISEPSKLSMEVSYTPILCNGGKSTVTVSAEGGTAPYTGTGSWEVSAGTYTYTVKDANGCEVSKEITISEPSKLSMEVSYTSILCNGGKSTVTVTADGGTAPYTGTGSWEVSAGTYTYTVKDANGCEVSKKITISEPSKLSMEVSYTPILCNGGKSTVTVSANGGTAPYTGTGSWEVSAGTYTYTVKDANGCEVSKEITITQPTPLELTIVAEKLVCYDGKVQLTANVSGGTSPYTYSWSNGETTQMITVGAGSYTVTVKDANGCMISKNVEVKVPTCDGFTTVTQGGWGAKAAGKNWGAYRDANFAAAFPTGLMVGTALRNLKLSSAKAVDDFLPSGSSPRALDKSYVNPGQTYQNVFAGQVVALTLSVRFDEWDANFSSNSIKLGDLIVNSGTFAGWTVYQILAEANKVLAGEAFMYSASQLNAIVDAINNNYDNGKVNLGLLSCPCPTVEKPVAKVAAPAKSTPDVIANQEAVLYPNPSSGEFNLRFDAPKESKILVQIYNAQGTLVADYSSKVVRNNNKASLHVNNSNLAAGLYLVKVKTSTQEKTIKLIIRK